MKFLSQQIINIRVITYIIVVLILSYAISPTSAFARYAAIVLDADTGRILHATNPDTLNYPASLTKMMTLYLVFEALEAGQLTLKHRLPVSARAASVTPSRLGVKRGDTITVETVILALVTKSANDAAVVIAEFLGGTEANFARIMTQKAHSIGMLRTSFRNASGLPNRHQLSTARDMALLANSLVRNFPQQYRYFSRQRYNFRGEEFTNHNNLLRTYPGTDGIKTGYIRASGFNLAASANRDGRRLIGVVFGGRSAKSRDQRMANLLEQAFKTASKSSTLPDTRWVVLHKRHTVTVPLRPKPRVAPVSHTKPAIALLQKHAPVRPANWLQPQPSLVARPSSKGWAIQVGAYRNIEPARTLLQKAIAHVPKLTKKTRASISPFIDGDTLIYRARLTGLSSETAKKACRRLEQRKIPCFAIASKGLTASQGSQR